MNILYLIVTMAYYIRNAFEINLDLIKSKNNIESTNCK